jgi:Fur family ferric uptake transcriptional regulator
MLRNWKARMDRRAVRKDGAMRERQAALVAALKAEGVRITRQRTALLGVIAAADDHPDANEIHRRVHALDPTTSLSTVYRTMQILESRGVIQRHSFEVAPARFETNDQSHHDHIVDIDTGQVIEFRSARIEELQAQIAAELGYDVVRHKLELYCRRKKA